MYVFFVMVLCFYMIGLHACSYISNFHLSYNTDRIIIISSSKANSRHANIHCCTPQKKKKKTQTKSASHYHIINPLTCKAFFLEYKDKAGIWAIVQDQGQVLFNTMKGEKNSFFIARSAQIQYHIVYFSRLHGQCKLQHQRFSLYI